MAFGNRNVDWLTHTGIQFPYLKIGSFRNLVFLLIIVNKLFKFQAQDNNLEQLFLRSEFPAHTGYSF